MKRKELTKTFMMILNRKIGLYMYTNIPALQGLTEYEGARK